MHLHVCVVLFFGPLFGEWLTDSVFLVNLVQHCLFDPLILVFIFVLGVDDNMSILLLILLVLLRFEPLGRGLLLALGALERELDEGVLALGPHHDGQLFGGDRVV